MAKLAVTLRFGRHVGVGAGAVVDVVAPVDEVVAGARHRRHRRAAAAIVDRLRGGAGDRAVGTGRVGQGVGVDGEAGGHRDVGGHVGVGAGGGQTSSLQLTKW